MLVERSRRHTEGESARDDARLHAEVVLTSTSLEPTGPSWHSSDSAGRRIAVGCSIATREAGLHLASRSRAARPLRSTMTLRTTSAVVSRLACLALLPVLAIGCVDEDDAFTDLAYGAGDVDNDAVASDAFLAYGAGDVDNAPAALESLPAEGSPLAYGMLRVANELDHTELDVDVALDRRAADSIIAHRAGTDAVLGTADDRYVASIAELDSLYWLGAAQLTKIQSYATNEGFVPASVPAAACEPEVDAAVVECMRFLEIAATPEPVWGGYGAAPFQSDLVPSCLEASAAPYPSAAFFADAGLPGYLDPTLGYHGLLCDDAPEPVCALGVAGLGDHVQPECQALFDVTPALSGHEVDPTLQGEWDAAVAALDAASYDVYHHLRVYDYEPGMAPTLLGDVMGSVLYDAPIEYQGPYLVREASDVLPPFSAGAQALLTDVIADLGLGGEPFDVGTAAEEVPCHNCHTFHDSYVLLFRGARIVVVFDVETFWDS